MSETHLMHSMLTKNSIAFVQHDHQFSHGDEWHERRKPQAETNENKHLISIDDSLWVQGWRKTDSQEEGRKQCLLGGKWASEEMLKLFHSRISHIVSSFNFVKRSSDASTTGHLSLAVIPSKNGKGHDGKKVKKENRNGKWCEKET